MNARITLPTIPEEPHDDDVATAKAPSVVTRFDVERYHVGELQGAERAWVEAAIDADPGLKRLLDELRAEDAAFLTLHPPTAFERAFDDAVKARQPTSIFSRLLDVLKRGQVQLGLGLGAAACAAVLVVSQSGGPITDVDIPSIRTKGGAHGGAPGLGFFVKSDDGARLGLAGEPLHAGDAIQLAVTDAALPAMVVLGVDSAGVVSVYRTEDGSDDSRTKGAEAGKPRLLPQSLVLDDVVGPERFFVVYGDDLATLLKDSEQAANTLAAEVKAGTRSLKDATALPLPATQAQASTYIQKVTNKNVAPEKVR